MTDDFEAFLRMREVAAVAFVNANFEPLAAMTTQADPATFFGPGGGAVVGQADVNAAFRRDGGKFVEGDTRFEILNWGSDGSVGYWTGYQHGSVRRVGQDAPAPVKLRITEVFRKEDGAWKIVHRHADSLADQQKRP